MKFFKLGVVALLAIGFSSCSVENQITRSSGEWNMTSYTLSGTSEEMENGQVTSTASITGVASNITMMVTFMEDGTFTVAGSFDMTLSFESDGWSFSFPIEDANSLTNGTYTIDGDDITLDPSNGDAFTGMVDISGSTMTISYEETEVEEDNGVTTTETNNITMVFERA